MGRCRFREDCKVERDCNFLVEMVRRLYEIVTVVDPSHQLLPQFSCGWVGGNYSKLNCRIIKVEAVVLKLMQKQVIEFAWPKRRLAYSGNYSSNFGFLLLLTLRAVAPTPASEVMAGHLAILIHYTISQLWVLHVTLYSHV